MYQSKQELLEQVKTIKNLCEVSEILIELGRENLLPTVLECLYLEAQDIIDICCVEEDESFQQK